MKAEVEDYLEAGLGIDEIIQQYVEDDRVANIDGGPDMLAGRYGLIWRLKPELFEDEAVELDEYAGQAEELVQEESE